MVTATAGSWAKRKYRRFKKDHCEAPDCMWYGPYIQALLDVDHADGDRTNNDPENLVTLCANCHRLKTMRAGDHLPRLSGLPS